MTAAAISGVPGLSPEAVRLRGYLRWAIVPTFVAGPVLFGLAWLGGSVFVFLVGFLTMANAPIALLGYRLAGRNRLQAAVFCQAAGLWAVGLALALTGAETLGLTVLLAILPVALALPCVSPRTLRAMGVLGTAVIAVAGGIVLLESPPFPLDELPAFLVRPLQGIGIAILTAVCGVSIWQNGMTLHQFLLRFAAANEALAASEQSLERRVRERTAELERSERELADARDAALEANRLKSAFLARMSHELRTPLNAVLGFSEVLGARTFGELNEKQAEYVNDIHASGQHLLSLINDILDLSRVEAGALALEPSVFDLRTAIENALTLVRERAARKSVAIAAALDPSLGEIEADERKIRQVLINLLTNAIKFTPEGGTVTVEASANGGTTSVVIADTGVGISDDDQRIIFEDYRQAGGGRPPGEEGTGLGLPLSKRIIELHGGRIGVESAPGTGSRFSFTIPVHAATSRKGAQAP